MHLYLQSSCQFSSGRSVKTQDSPQNGRRQQGGIKAFEIDMYPKTN